MMEKEFNQKVKNMAAQFDSYSGGKMKQKLFTRNFTFFDFRAD